jgi:hypothetical protein
LPLPSTMRRTAGAQRRQRADEHVDPRIRSTPAVR